MTASKSSRARNARAQGAQAAGGRNGNAPAGRNGTAVKDGAVKAGTGAKAGPAGNAGTAVKAAGRPQPGRGAADEQDVAEGPVSGAVPLWLQIVTWAVSLAGLGVSIYLTIAHFTESAL